MSLYAALTPEQKYRAVENTRRWRSKNRDYVNALARKSQKKARAANPELHRQRAKEWKAKNYERYKANHTKWRHANREHLNAYRREQHYKQKYGITIEQRDAMLAAQGGQCATGCGATTPGNKIGWVVDHDHETGKLRGILCHNCNLGIGHAKDSTETLKKWAAYLERHR